MSSSPPDEPGQPPYAVSGMGWEDPGPEHPFEADPAGRYQRGALLGQGGMGRVFSALDQRLGRRVALKVLRSDDPELEARMAREAHITARLEHPGIVPVYDAGRGPDGRLFYTMALVDGRTLDQAIREAETPADRRPLLRPLLSACEAMAHAHARGVLHRDLKPSNILVGDHGATLVVDWGLAKDLDAPVVSAELGGETLAGTVLGTPAFMSPEQARGEALGPGSDVWSLGSVLYAVLTGAAPFQGDSASDVLRQVQVGEPPQLGEAVPAELRAIVARAMAPQPQDRYPDADALAQDLARYLDGRRVLAHAYTPAERASRAIVAWRVPIAAGALALLGVSAAAGLAWRQAELAARDAATARDEVLAVQVESDANLQSALVNQAVLALDRDARAEAEVLAAAALVLDGSDDQRAIARGVLAAWGDRPRPELLSSQPTPTDCVPLLSADGSRLVCVTEGLIQGWSLPDLTQVWAHHAAFSGVGPWGRGTISVESQSGGSSSLIRMRDGALVAERPQNRGEGLIAESDSPTLGASFSTHWASAYDIEGVPTPTDVFCPDQSPLSALAIAHDGLLLVACRGSILLGPMGGPYATLEDTIARPWTNAVNSVWTASFSKDTHIAAVGTLEGWVEVLDADTGTSLAHQRLGQGMVERVAVDAARKRVAVSIERGGTLVWSWDTGHVTRLPGHARALLWVDDVLWVVDDDWIRSWRIPAAEVPARLHVGSGLTAVAMHPGGALLGLSAGDSAGVLDPLAPDARPWHSPAPRSIVKDGAFSMDGDRFLAIRAVSGDDPGVLVLDTETGEPIAELQDSLAGRRVGTLQGDVVWALPWGSGPMVWAHGRLMQSARVGGSEFREGESNHSGTAAVLREDKSGALYRLNALPTPTLEAVLRPEVLPQAVDITDDGQRLVLLELDALKLVDLATQAEIWSLPTDGGSQDVAISPGDALIAHSDVAGHVWVRDLETGALLAVLSGHRERVYCVEFSPDGRWLLSGSWDDTVRIWDLSGLREDPNDVLERVTREWSMSLQDALALGR